MDTPLPDEFDVVIVGTAIPQSYAASQLAKSNLSILHLDPLPYYGAHHASLTLDELQTHLSLLPTASFPASLPPHLERLKRRYSISLFPGILSARGELVEQLIKTDVGQYVTFRMLDRVMVWSEGEGDGEGDAQGRWMAPPATKSQVFKSKQMTLLEKRRLMKFLLFAGGEFESSPLLTDPQTPLHTLLTSPAFSLPPNLTSLLLLASAHASTTSPPAGPTLHRLRKYLRGLGRFGGEEVEAEQEQDAEGEDEEEGGVGAGVVGGGGTGGGWLVGMYGGAGEVVQAFCRAAAVHGATYILGPESTIEYIKPLPDAPSTSPSTALSTTTPRPRTLEISIPGAHPTPIRTSAILCPSDHPALAKLVGSSSALESGSGAAAPALGSSGGTTKRRVNAVCVVEGVPGCLRRRGGGADDIAFLVFPPKSTQRLEGDEEEVVRAMFVGPGSGSCPDGQHLLYLQATLPGSSPTPTAADLSTPFVEPLRILFPSPTLQPSYSAFYLSPDSSPSFPNGAIPRGVTVVRRLGGEEGQPEWVEGMDWEVGEGGRLVEVVKGYLGVQGGEVAREGAVGEAGMEF